VSPVIVPVGPDHFDRLRALFDRISDDFEARYFHPHPFTAAEAKIRSTYAGRDIYVLMLKHETAIGYGFLRGWDANYAIPSLGIYVVAEQRGTGAARTLMDYLHAAAARRGASRVRLKVHPDNGPARRLYERLGYRFRPALEDGELVGFLDLPGVL